MKPTRNRTPFKKTPSKVKPPTKDPVQVFCRIRPLQNENEVSCMKVVSPTTVHLISPESAINYRSGTYKELQFTFKQVFVTNDSQKKVFDIVSLPLVENFIQGRNGLLFTYGVTGSGKTYTMTGEPNNGGIMPRCLDVIFNTLGDLQAKKFVFKPDRMNGFDVQCEADAMTDRHNELCSMFTSAKTPRKKDSNGDLARIPDGGKVDGIDEDNTFAVFVTYIEIYNNNTYDLLEDNQGDTIRAKPLQNRIIREDANHNMYVHGVTEVEVKTTEEAFEAFYKGQKKKRMAHTTLNAESSRSHSVFTIRLVQAPLDRQGEAALLDKKAICISQLSLVDLAGSERTNRTKNSGQRLREAGNINNSLMTLRSCLEILRENQLQGTNKMVPYRDSRITHLFKNYFDGEGQIRVIVCVNPRADDYDETVHVMKFAELTQEVQVTRPAVEKVQLDLLPGRRKANQLFKQAVQKIEELGQMNGVPFDCDIGLVYSLGPPFPSLEMSSADCERIILNLVTFLELRIARRAELVVDLSKKQEKFRHQLIEVEKENILCKQEASSAKATLDQERRKTTALESKLVQMESLITNMQGILNEKESRIEVLQHEVKEKDMQLSQRTIEKEKVKQKYSHKFAAETEKMSREMQQKLKMQKDELKTQMRDKEEKLRRMKHILGDITPASTPRAYSTRSDSSLSQIPAVSEVNLTSAGGGFATPFTPRRAANPGHRRSRSASGDVWLDHRSAMPTSMGTVLQPVMKRRKSVTKLTDVNDLVGIKTSKYCLTTQEHDSGGDLETRLYKADVVPTSGGGAQIIFNEMETLKQRSPRSSPPRKRNAVTESNEKDVKSACSIAIEGHGKKPRL